MGEGTGALTPRQQRFVEEYLVDLNGARAAIRAGYSERSAKQRAYEALRKPAVAEAVVRGLASSRVFEELAAIAFADVTDFFAWGPDGVAVKDSGALDKEITRAVAEVVESRTSAGGTVRVKLHDKLAALDKLARALGLFRERTEPEATPPPVPGDPREVAKAVLSILAAAHTDETTPKGDDTP